MYVKEANYFTTLIQPTCCEDNVEAEEEIFRFAYSSPTTLAVYCYFTIYFRKFIFCMIIYCTQERKIYFRIFMYQCKKSCIMKEYVIIIFESILSHLRDKFYNCIFNYVSHGQHFTAY